MLDYTKPFGRETERWYTPLLKLLHGKLLRRDIKKQGQTPAAERVVWFDIGVLMANNTISGNINPIPAGLHHVIMR